MITKIHIRGYKKFKELVLEPRPEMNILVGGNEAGKSTLLEAISLALTGKLEGINAQEVLNPLWFNLELVNDFFQKLAHLEKGSPLPPFPEFRIDLHLETPDGDSQKMRGINNMLAEDSVGISICAAPDPDYLVEIEQYFNADDCPPVIPVEYYRLEWRDFADQAIYRRPKSLGIAMVDSRTIRENRGMDYYTRQLLEEYLDPKARNHVSVEHRKMRAELGSSLLKTLNETLIEMHQLSASVPKVGIQVDQSRSTSWANTLVPSIGDVPFSQSGKGAQAIAKTILAIASNSNSSSYLLVEEPENHLSHTRLRELLGYITSAKGNRQVFVTTHSSFVLNRLGLEQLILLHEGKASYFDQLSKETSTYYQKISGFDTLRIVLADKIVLVEGPSDEIIFNRFFKDKFGKDPHELGVDVMSIGGVSFSRGFELAAVLERSIFGLRDNDDQSTGFWQGKISKFTQPGVRELFVGESDLGRTLEYQLCNKNSDEQLRQVLGIGEDTDPSDWMVKNKTDAALRISNSQFSLTPPHYMRKALDAIQLSNSNVGD